MIKVYRKLLKEQIERGVIFSCQMLPTDHIGDLHEVFKTDVEEDRVEANAKIKRLKNVKFFVGWGHDADNRCICLIRSV